MIVLDRGSAATAPSWLAVLLLSSAIQSGRRVMLCYCSARGELSERTFDPYESLITAVLVYDRLLPLAAGQRLFRVDRITHIELTSDRFPQRVNNDALEEVSQALASVLRVWQVEVWLETTLDDAVAQMRQPRACFEEASGGVLYRVDVENQPWMARLLAGFGRPFHLRFIVHRPRELWDVVRQYAGTLVIYAERSET